MNIVKTHIKFTQIAETGEIIGFVSRNTKTGELRGVLESSEYPKKVCVLSKDLQGTIEPNVLYDVEMKPMLSGNGYVVISAERIKFEAEFKTTKIPNKVYQIEIKFGNKTIYFDPLEGAYVDRKTIEGVCAALDKRKDLSNKEDVKKRFIKEAESLTLQIENDSQLALPRITDPVKLKKKMSYQEMEGHMRSNSWGWKSVNKVNVGLYAKRLGYEVYKTMINGQVCHFYINKHIEESNGSSE